MHVADISLHTEEAIFRVAPYLREHFLDPALYEMMYKFDIFKLDFELAMRVDLEIKFISELISKDTPVILKVENPYVVKVLAKLNETISEYEKAFIIKPFLSNPLDMTFYVLCYNKRNIDDPRIYRHVINNNQKMKRYLFTVAANAENILIHKSDNEFMRRRMYYISFFQSALIEKYETKK